MESYGQTRNMMRDRIGGSVLKTGSRKVVAEGRTGPFAANLAQRGVRLEM
jgi:hypothetical protein